ncbi:hypothetical protein [Mesorhizobium sp. M0220]
MASNIKRHSPIDPQGLVIVLTTILAITAGSAAIAEDLDVNQEISLAIR